MARESAAGMEPVSMLVRDANVEKSIVFRFFVQPREYTRMVYMGRSIKS